MWEPKDLSDNLQRDLSPAVRAATAVEQIQDRQTLKTIEYSAKQVCYAKIRAPDKKYRTLTHGIEMDP